MSLLIKALDKAQAEKAGANKDTTSKKTAAKTKSEKLAKKRSAKPAETLSIEEPKKDISSKSEQVAKSASGEVPQALKGSAADTLQKTKPNTADKLALTAPTEAAPNTMTNQPVSAPAQAQAANVFSAKTPEPSNRTATIAVILGLLALVLMGALAYWYQTVFNTPDIVIPPRPVASQETPKPLPEVVAENSVPAEAELAVVEPEMIDSAEAVLEPEAQPEEPVSSTVLTQDDAEPVTDNVEKQETTVFRTTPIVSGDVVESPVEETLADNERVVDAGAVLPNSDADSNDVEFRTESASITITPNKGESGINTVLMRAYEAYNAGNDQQAAQDYKAVLKRYGANVDAMLGLGAIATRQGRAADANGWYRKVLELEPRNDVAKAGLLSLQQGQPNQPRTTESDFKAMIATTPNDANLHAALGDVYANQNQWPAAQQAYFDAYRLGQTAENAFNLGVSLDQLGKPALALPYYREALQKAEQSSVIDVETLKARISSIE